MLSRPPGADSRAVQRPVAGTPEDACREGLLEDGVVDGSVPGVVQNQVRGAGLGLQLALSASRLRQQGTGTEQRA
jgi:hypothetical protein